MSHMAPDKVTLSFKQKLLLIFIGLLLAEGALQLAGIWVRQSPFYSANSENKGSPLEESAIRILTIGESTTEWGGGHSYPSRLQTLL